MRMSHRGLSSSGDTAIHVTDVKEVNGLPYSIKLNQCYPNPFNSKTTIDYELFKRSFATLEVFGVMGKKVSTLVNDTQERGTHRVVFNGSDLSNGIYFYRLTLYKRSKSREKDILRRYFLTM